MKIKMNALFAGCGLLASASLFAGPPNIEPGLWEYKVDISSKSGAVEAAMAQAKLMMAALPPEQRAMMEQAMASRGMQVDLGNQSFKSCLTKADIEQMKLPNVDKNCEQSLTQASANTYNMTMKCTGNPPMQGQGTFVVDSRKAMHGTITMDTTMQGQPEQMTIEQKGRWLSAGCATAK